MSTWHTDTNMNTAVILLVSYIMFTWWHWHLQWHLLATRDDIHHKSWSPFEIVVWRGYRCIKGGFHLVVCWIKQLCKVGLPPKHKDLCKCQQWAKVIIFPVNIIKKNKINDLWDRCGNKANQHAIKIQKCSIPFFCWSFTIHPWTLR